MLGHRQPAHGPGLPLEAPYGYRRLERRLAEGEQLRKRLEGHAGATPAPPWNEPRQRRRSIP